MLSLINNQYPSVVLYYFFKWGIKKPVMLLFKKRPEVLKLVGQSLESTCETTPSTDLQIGFRLNITPIFAKPFQYQQFLSRWWFEAR